MREYAEIAPVIDSCHSLFLREISEPGQNVLRLVLVEGIPSDKVESIRFAATQIDNVRRVRAAQNSRVLELLWNHYIAYSVTNESFSKADGAPHSGRFLRHYSESPFLEYVKRSTCATDEYPGPPIHMCIVTETHIVDVVSTEMPTLRLLQPGV
jgi:hypothetical protein